MSSRSLGMAYVLAAALLWSLGGLGIKLVDAGPLAIGGLRSLFALPILLLAIGPRQGPAMRSGVRSWRVWVAAFAYAGCTLSFAVATRWTTAANAIALQYTGPVYVAVLSGPLLGEKLRRTDWIAVVGCVGGMALFAYDGLAADSIAGALLALFSGVMFGALPLALRSEIARGNAAASELAILLGNAIGVVVTLPFIWASPPTSATSWAVVAGLGLVQIGTAYVFYTAGLKRLRAVDASLITTVEPVLNPVWVAIGTGEIPGLLAALGGLCIVGSVVLQGLAARWFAPPESAI